NTQHAFLQAPIAPGGNIVVHGAVLPLDGNRGRQFQHVPQMLDPGAGADDDLFALDRALVGFHGRHGARRILAETGDRDPADNAHALALRLAGQAVNGGGIVGIAALLFVQNRGDAGGAPIVEDVFHVAPRGGFTFDEYRVVAYGALLLVDLGHVLAHAFMADLHVTDRVIAERRGVGLPDAHAVLHELTHGRLEIVVADDAAGDAAGAGGNTAFVEHDDIAAVAFALSRQQLRQVPRRGQAVNARAYNDEAGLSGKCHDACSMIRLTCVPISRRR